MQCGFAKLSIHTKMGKHLMYLCIRVRLVMEFLIWWVKILKEKNLWIDIFWTETDNFAIFLFQSGSPKSKTLLIKLSTYLLVLFKCWPTKGKKIHNQTDLTMHCFVLHLPAPSFSLATSFGSRIFVAYINHSCQPIPITAKSQKSQANVHE